MQQGLCTEAHHQSDGPLRVGAVWHPPDTQQQLQVLAPLRYPGQVKLQLRWLIPKTPGLQEIQEGRRSSLGTQHFARSLHEDSSLLRGPCRRERRERHAWGGMERTGDFPGAPRHRNSSTGRWCGSGATCWVQILALSQYFNLSVFCSVICNRGMISAFLIRDPKNVRLSELLAASTQHCSLPSLRTPSITIITVMKPEASLPNQHLSS